MIKGRRAGRVPSAFSQGAGHRRGTNVKVLATGKRTPRKVPSGPTMTARRMVETVRSSSPIGRMMSSRWDIQMLCGLPGQLRNPRTWTRDGLGLISKRPSGESGQRCRDAGARELRRQAHAVLGTRHRPGLRADHRRGTGSDGTGPIGKATRPRTRWGCAG